MNKSDKLFMETAEKQQEIIDVLLEACKYVLSDKAKLEDGRINAECICKLSIAINKVEKE